MAKTIISIGLFIDNAMFKQGEIIWADKEDFSEIKAYGPVYLEKTKAVDINKMEGLSVTSKILLSAVAGAALQHIIDVLNIDWCWRNCLVIYIEEESNHENNK